MTYQQQIRGQLIHEPFMCPWKKLIQDLQAQIIEWQSDGDQVIILADMNDNVQEDPILAMATQTGLHDAVTTQHGSGTPNTHNRGSTPINGIFIPADYAPVIQSGYLAFDKGIPSNHRAVWVDIPLNILGWLQASECIPLQARRLKCKDPRIVQKYLQALEEELSKSNMINRLETLVQQASGSHLTRAQKNQLKTIDTETTMAKIAAEKRWRKLMVGAVQWCPKVTQAIARILYWKGIKKQQGEAILEQNICHALPKEVAPATNKKT